MVNSCPSSPKKPGRNSSHGKLDAMPVKASSSISGRVAWENFEKEIGEPISEVMSCAISRRRGL